MSVVVKGMKMPELYETYKVNFAMTNDGKIVMGMCLLNETGYRPVGEVVALPDKHGRLVDADAFKVCLRNALKQTRNAYSDKGEWAETITEQFCDAIDDQLTIVEAEDEP